MVHGFAVRISMVIHADATTLLHLADRLQWLVTVFGEQISADRVGAIAGAEVRGSTGVDPRPASPCGCGTATRVPSSPEHTRWLTCEPAQVRIRWS